MPIARLLKRGSGIARKLTSVVLIALGTFGLTLLLSLQVLCAHFGFEPADCWDLRERTWIAITDDNVKSRIPTPAFLREADLALVLSRTEIPLSEFERRMFSEGCHEFRLLKGADDQAPSKSSGTPEWLICDFHGPKDPERRSSWQEKSAIRTTFLFKEPAWEFGGKRKRRFEQAILFGCLLLILLGCAIDGKGNVAS